MTNRDINCFNPSSVIHNNNSRHSNAEGDILIFLEKIRRDISFASFD